MHLIGVDCAVDPRNVGIARGVLEEGHLRLLEVSVRNENILDKLTGWLTDGQTTLIALDAPLGWPITLGDELVRHCAGAALGASANRMFRRLTDDVVAEKLGRRPLDVGADRIARTCHAATYLIGELRSRTGLALSLAWEPGHVDGSSVIECYPAGTLASLDLPSSAYKGKKGKGIREALAKALAAELEIPADGVADIIGNDHALDAIVCVVAAADFMRGNVIIPDDSARALREGWIWVRPRRAHRS